MHINTFYRELSARNDKRKLFEERPRYVLLHKWLKYTDKKQFISLPIVANTANSKQVLCSETVPVPRYRLVAVINTCTHTHRQIRYNVCSNSRRRAAMWANNTQRGTTRVR